MPASSSSVIRMHRSGIRLLMELAMKDPQAIRLEIGEPDVPTAPHVIDAAARGAEPGTVTVLEVEPRADPGAGRDPLAHQ